MFRPLVAVVHTCVTILLALVFPHWNIHNPVLYGLQLFCHSSTKYFCTVYLSPNSAEYPGFFGYLTSKVEHILTNSTVFEIFIVGDFSAHHHPSFSTRFLPPVLLLILSILFSPLGSCSHSLISVTCPVSPEQPINPAIRRRLWNCCSSYLGGSLRVLLWSSLEWFLFPRSLPLGECRAHYRSNPFWIGSFRSVFSLSV